MDKFDNEKIMHANLERNLINKLPTAIESDNTFIFQ